MEAVNSDVDLFPEMLLKKRRDKEVKIKGLVLLQGVLKDDRLRYVKPHRK